MMSNLRREDLAWTMLRQGTALLVLWDLFDRAMSLRFHYVGEWFREPMVAGAISFHGWHPSFEYQACLFVLNAVAAIALFLGAKGSLPAVACWLFNRSLQNHNPYVLYGADRFLTALLLVSIFVSGVDRDRKKLYVQIATWVFMVQVAVIYFFTGLNKAIDPMWQTGEALGNSLAAFPMPLGLALREHPVFVLNLGRLVPWFQILGAMAALASVLIPKIRSTVFWFFIFFHAGLALSLDLAWFPYVCFVAWIPYWNGFVRDDSRWTQRLVVTGAVLAIVVVLQLLPRLSPIAGPLLHSAGLAQNWSFFSPVPVARVRAKLVTTDFAGKSHQWGDKDIAWSRSRWNALMLNWIYEPELSRSFLQLICEQNFATARLTIEEIPLSAFGPLVDHGSESELAALQCSKPN